LQVKRTPGNSVEELTLTVFDVEGKMVGDPRKISHSQKQLISVSPSKKHFAILSENAIIVYDTDLNTIKNHTSKVLGNSDEIAISNGGSGILIKGPTSLTFVDLQVNKEI